MNILSYKRSNKVYFDNLANGDVFIFDNKVYMKVRSKILLQDEKNFSILYYDGNNNYDFCVNLETGEPMEIAGGTWVEPLSEVEIKKDENWHIN